MNSSSKGHSFEREIAVKLSLWWSDNKRDDIFYRSQSSGARATQRNKSNKTTEGQGGDIASTCSEGEPLIKNWSIEIKTGYQQKSKLKDGTNKVTNWDILDFIDSKQKEPVLEKMWNQCKRDAELTNRTPILIFRRNGRTPCIMMKIGYELELQEWFSSIPHSSIWTNTFDKCSIMSLQNFFKWIPDIRSALK